ncbi:MAG: hypothetical protein L3J43_05170 [Sulfurovum sp.]|nr:hypothetical protein [Sulfurovum sp.]
MKNNNFILKLSIIFSLVIILLLIFYTFTPLYKFESSKWKANIDVRENMVEDLINSKILIGKNRKEVISILGSNLEMRSIDNKSNLKIKTKQEILKPIVDSLKEEMNNSSNKIVYYPIGKQYFAKYLYIKFENHKVVDIGIIAD